MELKDCLALFNGIDQISEKEGVKCDTCGKATRHIRQMSLSRTPPILIIHLKRFKIINK